MIKVAILTIGDEICIGQIVNSNAAWLAEKCARQGAKVFTHSTIGDDRDAMFEEISRLEKISDIIIITGGLGPTHDDITKPVLTEYFSDELRLHQPTLDYLKEFFEKRGYNLSEKNKAQALVPSKCKPLLNKVGTAPGMQFESESSAIFSLPGVPAEMKYLSENYVLPFVKKLIEKRQASVAFYKVFQTAGVPESLLADKIGDISKFIGESSLAFLPSYSGVRLRIGTEAENFAKAREEIKRIANFIRSKVGEHIISEDEKSLLEVTAELLKEKGKTVSVAESCTGGLLGGAFTELSGSSAYFAGGAIVYSNEMKTKILGVKEETLIEHGAVSGQTAKELARNAREKFAADYGLSITGIAGPTGGTDEKPVGTVWFGIADENGVLAKKYVFGSRRDVNRERSVSASLNLLYNKLIEK